MHIITDDAADFAAGVAEANGITVIPVNVAFGTDEFLSTEMTKDEFYSKTDTVTKDNWPKTSQPTPYQYEQLIQGLIDQGETEFYIVTVGEKLSGTHASAVAATKQLEGKATFHIFNTTSASTMQGFMALDAAKMAKEGKSADEINAHLTRMRDEGRVWIVIESLDWAVKGGRVGALRSAVASLLNIKPIMQLKEGEITEAAKVRTSKKAIGQVIDLATNYAGDRPVRFTVMHAREPKGAARLMEQASAKLNISSSETVDLTLPVAINLGPGTLAVMVMPD